MFDLLLPPRCALCASTGTALCRTCIALLPAAPDLGPPPGFAACHSLLRYDGPTKQLVAALKFRNHRDAIPVLGAAMAALIEPIDGAQVDLVTWAPTSPERRRARGYDQAEQLARCVADGLRRPNRPLLRRRRSGPQTGRTRSERLDGVAFAPLSGARPTRAAPPRVVVVDDVRTTGATLCAAADALACVGVEELIGLTLAVAVRD